MENTRIFSPMKCQVADANNIACKDCEHRDRTVINVDGKKISVGITRSNCEMFVYPDSKPSDILFNGADCDFYEEE